MRSSGLSRSHSSNTSSVYALYLRMSLRMPAGLPAAVSSRVVLQDRACACTGTGRIDGTPA